MAIIRDASDSMSRPDQQYLLARYASATICRIIELARRSSMRVGYSEFGDMSLKYFARDSGARFFTRDYFGVTALAKNLATRGRTHYQKALQEVLEEFERLAHARGLSERMHAVMLSDGEPTLGCRKLHEERAWARRLGVCIHTIFVGEGLYPPVLARLAVETGGKRFHAIPNYQSGSIQIMDVSSQVVFEGTGLQAWV